MSNHQAGNLELSGANRPKFEVSISRESPAAVEERKIPIQITVSNLSNYPGEFYRSSLLGLTIGGIRNAYNMNLHFEYIPRNMVEIPAYQHDTFTIDLRDVWQGPKKLEPGHYRIIMRYEIEGKIYASNEHTIHLVP